MKNVNLIFHLLLFVGSGSVIRDKRRSDPGPGYQKVVGSGINIPDPQHCSREKLVNKHMRGNLGPKIRTADIFHIIPLKDAIFESSFIIYKQKFCPLPPLKNMGGPPRGTLDMANFAYFFKHLS
jgi:hypothetical protein